jgi:hypothetical protein
MALSKNTNRPEKIDEKLSLQPVDAAVHVYQGSLLSFNAANGCVRPLIKPEIFGGVAYEEKDNTGGAAAAVKVRTIVRAVLDMPLSGATQSACGEPVYATADDAISLTSSGNSFIGFQDEFVSTGRINVRLAPFATAP